MKHTPSVIETKNRKYDVYAQKKTLKGYHDALFGNGGALCKFVNNSVPGCEDAVAMTSWRFDTEGDLYDKDGWRRSLKKACTVKITMPAFRDLDDAENERHREEVLRFEKATESHETGHGAACESLTRIVNHFVAFLPERVAVKDVPAMNEAVKIFIIEFYETMARKADELFDKFTGHGGKFGAELAASLRAYGLYDMHTYFDMEKEKPKQNSQNYDCSNEDSDDDEKSDDYEESDDDDDEDSDDTDDDDDEDSDDADDDDDEDSDDTDEDSDIDDDDDEAIADIMNLEHLELGKA